MPTLPDPWVPDPPCDPPIPLTELEPAGCAFGAGDVLVGRVFIGMTNGVYRYILAPLTGPVVDPYDPAALGHRVGVCDEERQCAVSIDATGAVLAWVEIVTADISDPISVVVGFGTNTPYVPGPTHVGYRPCGVDTSVCDPYSASFTADQFPTVMPQPFNSWGIVNPTCCAVVVTTTAGSITVPAGLITYSPPNFDCNISLVSVTALGSCDLAEISMMFHRTGR